MGTCETCQHWSRHLTVDDKETAFGTCRCPSLAFEDDVDILLPDMLLHADAYAEYGGPVKTGKDFGCVHYQDRSLLEAIEQASIYADKVLKNYLAA